MTKNFFSFSPKTGVVLATVIFLMVLGAAYYFWYLPNNQSELEKRQFRGLQNIERNAKDKIDNSLALMNDLMENYDRPKQGYNRDSVISYIDKFSKKTFRLGYKKLHKDDDALNAVRTETDTLLKVSGKPKLELKAAVTINQDVILIKLQSKDILMQIEYTLKDFIEPLLPEGIFDNYMIFKKQDVIYQSFPSGIVSIVKDTLQNNKITYNKGPIRELLLSGNSYKIFSQQMDLKADGEITVAGLLNTQNYNYQRSKLPREAVIFLIIFVIAGILTLPWVKLFHMGSQDRMTASDGIFSMAVPLLLVSVLFFVFFCYNTPTRAEWGFEQAATSMSDSIKKEFKSEVDKTYETLYKAERLISKTALQKRRGFSDTIKTQLKELLKSVSVNQINVLDRNGQELQNWSPTGASAPYGNYSGRDYFNNLKKDVAFYVDSNIRKQYYLEPVVSRTTNNFTTVICIPHPEDSTFAAISFNLKCLDHPILTPGFQYVIVANDGGVLYHSDPTKQLNENLFAEFSDSTTLAANVHARTNAFFSTRYAGKRFDVFVSPIAGVPFSLVILENSSFISMRQINDFIFSFSMLFLFFLILGVEMMIIFLISIKSAYYKKHYFDISWIGPNTHFIKEYRLAFWGNCAVIALLIICWCTGPTFLEFVFIFLSVANLCYIYQNFLYARRYQRKENKPRYHLKMKAALSMLFILLFLNITSLVVAPGWRLFVFEGLAIAVMYGIYKRANPGLLNKTEEVYKDELGESYSLMVYSRLIITSGIPVALFFITTYNYDIKLTTRYRQAKFITEVLNRGIKNTAALDSVPVYVDKVWIDHYNFLSESQLKDSVKEEVTDAGVTAKTVATFNLLSMNQDQLVPGLAQMADPPQDTHWHFGDILGNNPAYSYYDLPGQQHLLLKSAESGYVLPLQFSIKQCYKTILFWVMFFGALYGFWIMFYHVIKRLFGLNLPSVAGWDIIDDLLLQDDELNNLLFLIGPPGSGKLEGVRKLIEAGKITGKGNVPIVYDTKSPEKINYFVADMITIPNDAGADPAYKDDWKKMKDDALNERYKLIIVNQFEYDIKNPESNRAKLAFLEDLLQKGKGKVIIVSTVHPVNFLDSLNREAAQTTETATGSPGHDLERWHVLLGHFKIVIQKLINNHVDDDRNDWQSTLKYETSSGRLLQKMQYPILSAHKELAAAGVTADSISLKLGITAHYFYMYVWQSLTKEEKFILYDLAEDGLLNPYDDYNIILLISKGLIVKEEGVLKLFNGGFRDFIMTAIGRYEAMQIQQQIKDTGNWSKLKIPLLLIIMAVLVFLFTSQKETYTDLIKILAVVTGGIPIVMQMFSQFGSKDSK